MTENVQPLLLSSEEVKLDIKLEKVSGNLPFYNEAQFKYKENSKLHSRRIKEQIKFGE
jgi:hypothetical protein